MFHFREKNGTTTALLCPWYQLRSPWAYVDRRADEIRILDIALLPEHRGRGIGNALLDALLAEAETAGKPVSIFVESHPLRARRFFERLGFEEAEDQGVSVLMEWRPR